MHQEPQQSQQKGETGKRAVLDSLIEQNSELREICSGGIEDIEQGMFVCPGSRNGRVLYLNCNVLLVGEQDLLTGKTEIRSYTFDNRGVVKPIYHTTADNSKIDPRERGFRAAELFDYFIGITEGRGFEQCEYVKIGQQGELLFNTNGTSCVLPRKYNPDEVSEMCACRKKIEGVIIYLNSLSKDPGLKDDIGLHAAMLSAKSNWQSLEDQYYHPKSLWVQ